VFALRTIKVNADSVIQNWYSVTIILIRFRIIRGSSALD